MSGSRIFHKICTGTNLVENSGAGQTVYTITATDAVGVVSYAKAGADASLLTLTGNVVSLNANPDYETKNSYSFTVTASDAAGNTSAPTTVTFSITNIADEIAPVITSGTTGTNLVENSGAGQTVYTIVATDAVGVVSYAKAGADASLLTLTGNVVSLNANPDYETKNSYSFTVTASDAAGNTSAPTTVTFSITNIADEIAPVITSGTTGTNLVENSGAGQTVYTIVATDAVGVVSYAKAGADASLLTLTGNVVSLNANPDYETKNSYSFIVTASDATGNTGSPTTVTFSIIDADEIAPVISITGDNPETIELDSVETYTDDGATATDNLDGSLTNSIVVSGDIVNTGVLGTYLVRYNVADAKGNNATEKIRTVNVVDTVEGAAVRGQKGAYTDSEVTQANAFAAQVNKDASTVAATNAANNALQKFSSKGTKFGNMNKGNKRIILKNLMRQMVQRLTARKFEYTNKAEFFKYIKTNDDSTTWQDKIKDTIEVVNAGDTYDIDFDSKSVYCPFNSGEDVTMRDTGITPPIVFNMTQTGDNYSLKVGGSSVNLSGKNQAGDVFTYTDTVSAREYTFIWGSGTAGGGAGAGIQNFDLGQFNSAQTVGINPIFDPLAASAIGDSDVVAAVTWTCAADKGWQKVFKFEVDADDVTDSAGVDIKYYTDKTAWLTEDGHGAIDLDNRV